MLPYSKMQNEDAYEIAKKDSNSLFNTESDKSSNTIGVGKTSNFSNSDGVSA